MTESGHRRLPRALRKWSLCLMPPSKRELVEQYGQILCQRSSFSCSSGDEGTCRCHTTRLPLRKEIR